MLTDIFRNVLSKEGVAPIVTWAGAEPHVTATWNSYIRITADGRLLLPAAGMQATQQNIAANPRIKMVFGSKEVTGLRNTPGAGFLLEGTARFAESGPEFDMMKAKFPFLSRVLEVTPTQLTQTL